MRLERHGVEPVDLAIPLEPLEVLHGLAEHAARGAFPAGDQRPQPTNNAPFAIAASQVVVV